MWTDSHCHIDASHLPAALDAGVARMVDVGTDAATSAAAIALAHSAAGIYATVGLHPHDASAGTAGIVELLRSPDPLVVAVGECGLDYYYEHSPREAQLAVFAEQVELARSLDLALVVHSRDAWEDTFGLLAEDPPDRLVFHCFTGGPPEARRALDLGAYLSFSGIVTFKNAAPVRESASLCPPDRLLVETDTPYLAPVPHRGEPNRPEWVPLVGAAVASIRGEAPEEVEEATWANAELVFRLR
ncbi:MAG TPA: TatD family hydrolase [Acidimicrobiales bacterium]|nr:TatD family hydrolase [Acidimicrobiales bacterium]